MRYTTPQPLILLGPGGSETPILAERITVTIPDQPDNRREISYSVIVDQPGKLPGMGTYRMLREQADELLELIGLSPVET